MIFQATDTLARISQHPDTLGTIAKLVVIIGGAATFLIVTTRAIPSLYAAITARKVSKRVGADTYPLYQLSSSFRHYMRPHFQDLDPAGGDEPRLVYGARQPLFKALDHAFSENTEYRHLILLADSGMGKSSALINYYARHIRKLHRPYKLVLLPLNISDVDQRIAAIDNKKDTVLLLDALDEDTLAIVDHGERMRQLIVGTREFAKVLISCRTQFFRTDEEIPRRTGIMVVGARAGGSAEHHFHKMYLSPLSEKQVRRYLRKIYPIWQWNRRKQAMQLAAAVPSLSVRPMLLSNFKEVLERGRPIKYAFEIYEAMVRTWINREDGFINSPLELRRFSELLAEDLYSNRGVRGSERIGLDELMQLVDKWNIAIDRWHLSGRSLLNRDAEGNFKFAHRSIMEYLYVSRALRSSLGFQGNSLGFQGNNEWTDQMQSFLREMVLSDTCSFGRLDELPAWMYVSAPNVPATLVVRGRAIAPIRVQPTDSCASNFLRWLLSPTLLMWVFSDLDAMAEVANRLGLSRERQRDKVCFTVTLIERTFVFVSVAPLDTEEVAAGAVFSFATLNPEAAKLDVSEIATIVHRFFRRYVSVKFGPDSLP